MTQPINPYAPPRRPRDAVKWLVAFIVLPPCCILFMAFGWMLHDLRTVTVLSALAVLLSAWVFFRRRAFDHPRVAVAAALVLLAWAALAVSAGAKTRSDSLRAAHATSCRSNLKQIGVAILMYTGDHDGAWPPGLQALIDGTFIRDTSILICPASGGKPSTALPADQWSSYAYAQLKTPAVAHPETVPIAWDRTPHPGSPPLQVLYADFHADSCEFSDFLHAIERAFSLYARQPERPAAPEGAREFTKYVVE